MVEGTQESPTTVHAQIAGRPNHRSSDIHSEYGVISGDFIEDFGDVLWMDRGLAGLSRRQIVESFARFAVVIETDIEISGVSLLHDPRKQCRERFRSASNNTEVQMTAPSELFLADIDLQNAGHSWDRTAGRGNPFPASAERSSRATCAGQNCDSRRTIEFGRQLIQLFWAGDNVRLSKREVDTAIVIFRIQ